MIIGLLHIRKDPKKVSRAYLYAAIAKLEGVELFYFTSKDVDFNEKTINGFFNENGKWVKRITCFPDVVINVGGPNTLKQTMIFDRLSRYVPFTSYKVGTKLSVYERIKKAKLFSEHVIPYRRIRNAKQVIDFIEEYKKIIIKPRSDSHGNMVHYLEGCDNGYLIKYRDKDTILSKEQLTHYVNQLLTKRIMLVQKYIESRRKTNEPYDLRLHMQKDDHGKWNITSIIPRVGPHDKIITNISQGGQLSLFDRFVAIEFGKNAKEIKDKVEKFCYDFSKHFDILYPYNFDELGIDVGIDENQKIWIYEVNWRPGHVFIESKAAKNAVKYAIYLAKTKMQEKEVIK